MYCLKCGVARDDNACKCTNCGEIRKRIAPSVPLPPIRPIIPSYLAWSILVTLFCCPPIGLVATVYSVQVKRRLRMEDIAAARDASKKAKAWGLISLGCGLAFVLLVLLSALVFLLTFNSEQ